MNIQEVCKIRKAELKLTYQEISDTSGVPLSTVQNFFSKFSKAPSIYTVAPIVVEKLYNSRKGKQSSGVIFVLIAYITCHIRRIPTHQQPFHYAHFAAPPCISIKYSKKDPTKSLKKVFVGSLLYGFLIWSAIFW